MDQNKIEVTPWDILTSGGGYEERIDHPECTTEVRINAADLAERVTKLLNRLGISATIGSGFRTAEVNRLVGGKAKSNHMTGCAVDLDDLDGSLADAIMQDVSVLTECGLYMENPQHTPTWVHLQIVAPRSGNRVFNP